MTENTPATKLSEGDLVELVTTADSPYTEYSIGDRLLVEDAPYQIGPIDSEDFEIPEGTWVVEVNSADCSRFAEDVLPVDAVKLIRRAAEQLPGANEIAQAVAGALHTSTDIDEIMDMRISGTDGEKGRTVFAQATTHDGVDFAFTLRVEDVRREGM